MRGWAILLALVLAACSREPDFDERYEAAKSRIGEAAAEIDAQVSGVPEER